MLGIQGGIYSYQSNTVIDQALVMLHNLKTSNVVLRQGNLQKNVHTPAFGL